MLEVRLCKPADLYISWKCWVGGNLNIINQWGNHKKGGGDKFFKFSGGEQKWGEHDFWLKFSGEKALEETMTLNVWKLWNLYFPSAQTKGFKISLSFHWHSEILLWNLLTLMLYIFSILSVCLSTNDQIVKQCGINQHHTKINRG